MGWKPLSRDKFRECDCPVALAFATLNVAHSASALGVVFAILTLTRVLALALGGVWADRLPRQLVMLTSDWMRAGADALIGILLVSGQGAVCDGAPALPQEVLARANSFD